MLNSIKLDFGIFMTAVKCAELDFTWSWQLHDSCQECWARFNFILTAVSDTELDYAWNFLSFVLTASWQLSNDTEVSLALFDSCQMVLNFHKLDFAIKLPPASLLLTGAAQTKMTVAKTGWVAAIRLPCTSCNVEVSFNVKFVAGIVQSLLVRRTWEHPLLTAKREEDGISGVINAAQVLLFISFSTFFLLTVKALHDFVFCWSKGRRGTSWVAV